HHRSGHQPAGRGPPDRSWFARLATGRGRVVGPRRALPAVSARLAQGRVEARATLKTIVIQRIFCRFRRRRPARPETNDPAGVDVEVGGRMRCAGAAWHQGLTNLLSMSTEGGMRILVALAVAMLVATPAFAGNRHHGNNDK